MLTISKLCFPFFTTCIPGVELPNSGAGEHLLHVHLPPGGLEVVAVGPDRLHQGLCQVPE